MEKTLFTYLVVIGKAKIRHQIQTAEKYGTSNPRCFVKQETISHNLSLLQRHLPTELPPWWPRDRPLLERKSCLYFPLLVAQTPGRKVIAVLSRFWGLFIPKCDHNPETEGL